MSETSVDSLKVLPTGFEPAGDRVSCGEPPFGGAMLHVRYDECLDTLSAERLAF